MPAVQQHSHQHEQQHHNHHHFLRDKGCNSRSKQPRCRIFLLLVFFFLQESFLLDLIEGIASNSSLKDTSREPLTQLADQLLDGVSKTLIYPSAPTVKALLEVSS